MENLDTAQVEKPSAPKNSFFRIRFRQDGQEFTARTTVDKLKVGDVVMVETEQGLEPARISAPAPACADFEGERGASFTISRRASGEELNRYANLPANEAKAFAVCRDLIERHALAMRLIRVENFFNGSKMIFYFTADNRVDFRGLVKDLVLEFRTRVEMRQVGVRHETKMLGGLGTCGRELCCCSYLKNFDSVSIKMAKEQDLPLNPAKISGVCNRLLCCLTYEYSTYKRERRNMPKVGKRITVGEETYKVLRQIPLRQSLLVSNSKDEELILTEEQWLNAEPAKGGEKPPVKKERPEPQGHERRDRRDKSEMKEPGEEPAQARPQSGRQRQRS